MLVNVLLANSIPTTLPSGFFPQVWFFLKYYYMSFLRGMGVTFIVSVVGTIFGFVLGIGLALLRKLDHPRNENKFVCFLKKFASGFAYCYIEFFRGTPMMVQAMFIYYLGKPVIGWTPITAGLIIISINTGAYMAEIIRSGIQSVDKGQNEAAMSLGMTTTQTLMYVVFPQAIKNSFPSIGNQLIVNIKDSSMLNVITVTELYFQTTSVAGSNYRYIETFMVSAVLYLILTTLASFLLNYLEKRMDSESSMKDFCS